MPAQAARMKILVALLIIANLALLGWFQGWMAPWGGEGREPGRGAREVRPDRLQILPAEGTPVEGTPAEGTRVEPAPASSDASPTSAALPMPPEAPADVALRAEATGPAWAREGCVELGPLTEAQAVSVQGALAGQALAISMLQPGGHETWWTYLLPAPEDAPALLETLRSRGLAEGAVLMREGVMRGAVVLGRYREVGNALAMQRRLILAGYPFTRLGARGGPPGSTVLRVQAADAQALVQAARSGSGPILVAPVPLTEPVTALLESQRNALRTAAAPVALMPCPADQAAVFSSRR
jgi:hypothetical protein